MSSTGIWVYDGITAELLMGISLLLDSVHLYLWNHMWPYPACSFGCVSVSQQTSGGTRWQCKGQRKYEQREPRAQTWIIPTRSYWVIQVHGEIFFYCRRICCHLTSEEQFSALAEIFCREGFSRSQNYLFVMLVCKFVMEVEIWKSSVQALNSPP